MAAYHDPAHVEPHINNGSELFLAIAKHDQQKVKNLIEEGGIFLRKTLDGWDLNTAAHIAAQTGNLPTLKYLLEREPELADVDDVHGQTILHIAAKKGDVEMLKYLVNVIKMDLRRVKDRLILKNAPIHMATEAGHLHVVKWYIEEVKPFKPDARNDDGETLLMCAAKKPHMPIVKYLIEYGYANPFLLDTYDANVLFQSAIIGDLQVPKYLLDERGFKLDVDQKNVFGITVVCMGARYSQLEFIKYFVEQKNAIIEIANNFDKTPLHEAAEEGNLEIVKYLVEHKAGIGRLEFHGKTPAQLSKNKEVVAYLNGVMEQRKREYEEYELSRARRSVSELFVQHSLDPQVPIPCRWIQNRINDQFLSSAGQVDSSAMMDTPLHLDNFLMLAGACAKYVRGVGSELANHQALLSPPELLREREDPIAFDAIDAMYDFEYPLMNND